MKGKLPNQNQRNLFRPTLKDILNPKHELAISTGRILKTALVRSIHILASQALPFARWLAYCY